MQYGHIVNSDTILDKGHNVKIGHGTVIGAYPLMFKKGTHKLIFGTKRVVLEDNVVIGNNVTIMGGFYRDTIIRKGAKIWDGTVIGHDCDIGENVAIATNATLNGEVNVGQWSFISSGVVVKPKVNIGEYVQVGLGAIVLGDIPDRGVVIGGDKPPKVVRINEWKPNGNE